MTPVHLFLATAQAAFGELKLGINLARELAREGERVIFLAPQALAVLFEGTPIRYVPVESALWDLEREVPALAAREGCRSLVLVDVTSVLLSMEELAVDASFLAELDLPVVVLDIWNVREADRRWDWGLEATPLPEQALTFDRRLLPVPLVRPGAGRGVYDALPHVEAIGAEERRAVRAGLGVGEEDRLVFLATSRWQMPEPQVWKHHQRLARRLPPHVLRMLASLGRTVHVLHVGPAALPGADVLEGRYHHSASVAPDRFRELLQAGDLMLSLNTASTAMLSAVSAGLPTVVAINSHAGRTVEEVLASLGGDGSPEMRSWLAETVPLHRFRLWPLGLFDFLAPVLAGNPFTSAFRTAEVLDEPAFVETCHALLFDGAAAARERERQRDYVAAVRALPGGVEAFRSQLADP